MFSIKHRPALNPGYNVPAVQQCAEQNQAFTQQAPAPITMPTTSYVNKYNEVLKQVQLQQQQEMMKDFKELLAEQSSASTPLSVPDWDELTNQLNQLPQLLQQQMMEMQKGLLGGLGPGATSDVNKDGDEVVQSMPNMQEQMMQMQSNLFGELGPALQMMSGAQDGNQGNEQFMANLQQQMTEMQNNLLGELGPALQMMSGAQDGNEDSENPMANLQQEIMEMQNNLLGGLGPALQMMSGAQDGNEDNENPMANLQQEILEMTKDFLADLTEINPADFESDDEQEIDDTESKSDKETSGEQNQTSSNSPQENVSSLSPVVAAILEDGSQEEKLKKMMRDTFIKELMRREKLSGTFDMAESTVKPMRKYPSDDPVAVWSSSNHDTSLVEDNLDPKSDCEYLHAVMKEHGTNEAGITHIVSTRCNSQRQELKKMFKTLYERDLIEDINTELKGDYKESVMACFVSPAVYDAWCIKEAIYGPGTDEQALIEILMTRTNAQIEELKTVYGDVARPNGKVSSTKIEDDIKGDCSGDYKRLLILASQGNRHEITPEKITDAVEEIIDEKGVGTSMFQVNYSKLYDQDVAKQEAEHLCKIGEKHWSTDDEFNLIFSTRHYYQLRAIWEKYVKITQRDILNSVDRETSGNFKAGLKDIVMNFRCRPMYFAQRLMKAMNGHEADDSSLIRLVVSRSEIDLEQIKKCFLDLTNQTLWNYTEQNCNGNYKKLLQAIIGNI